MISYNPSGEEVDVRRHSCNILGNSEPGIVHVKFFAGREECLKATEDEVFDALNEGNTRMKLR